MSWDAERYLSFGEARQRPAVELIARIPLAAPDRFMERHNPHAYRTPGAT